MFVRAGTARYEELLTRPTAARVVSRWFLNTNLLPYLALARELGNEGGRGDIQLEEVEATANVSTDLPATAKIQAAANHTTITYPKLWRFAGPAPL
jgi:hypothetical protein